MEQSASIGELAKALSAFQAAVENVTKDGSNPYFKSKYATLENIIDTIRPHLAKHGLSFSQIPTGENELSTILMHVSGEWLKATAKMTPKDQSPQGQGSAITYMRRYALSAALGIATEEDDDGNVASNAKPVKAAKIPEKHVKEIRKDQIVKLARAIGITQKDKAGFAEAIKARTEVELKEENYDEILEKLRIIYQQKQEK